MPGADVGLRPEDPTVAELSKPHGYATGQFGKNHLGDLDAMLPTNHGFDEFLGNLYHLNAEEEPEYPDYPKSPEFKKRFGPRGVLHSYADGRIQDTGPLTKKRMETVDQEFLAAALDFMDRNAKASKQARRRLDAVQRREATNWEGGFRVPTMIRWPGVIKPGTIYNEFFAHEDLIPTFLAAAGDTDVVARCMKSCATDRAISCSTTWTLARTR
jgi:arylsulfatase A-like enzyme